MEKLRLRMDELAVESFSVGDAGGGMGTVQGQMVPTPPYHTCYPCLETRLTCVCAHAVFAATRPQACDPFSLPPRCA
jgi:hypothetical protein